MQIKQNPFVSDIFSTKWLTQFNSNKPVFTFNFIGGLHFYKPSFLPIYINAGRNLTKGISYTLKKVQIGNFKNSIVLIYDIPDYFDVDTHDLPDHIKFHRIKQYPGYLTDLKKYEDLHDYLLSAFSKKRKDKLNRYKKRLELCFDISCQMFYGEITKEDYDLIFDAFKKLLEKRFNYKQLTNNNLNPDEWTFYYDVALPMILEKKASLFVVYEGSNPIAITLNYFSDNILFHGITVFDIDYSKFHLGKVALLNLFSWCFENNIHIFDFSKGHFDYKTHWMNRAYDFEYHVYYNNSSLNSRILAFTIKSYFELKQFLREKEVNTRLHRLTFWFKNNTNKSKSKFNFSEATKDYKESELLEIEFLLDDHAALKPIANEFLFLNSERLKDLKILQVKEDSSAYLFKGIKVSKKLVVN